MSRETASEWLRARINEVGLARLGEIGQVAEAQMAASSKLPENERPTAAEITELVQRAAFLKAAYDMFKQQDVALMADLLLKILETAPVPLTGKELFEALFVTRPVLVEKEPANLRASYCARIESHIVNAIELTCRTGEVVAQAKPAGSGTQGDFQITHQNEWASLGLEGEECGRDKLEPCGWARTAQGCAVHDRPVSNKGARVIWVFPSGKLRRPGEAVIWEDAVYSLPPPTATAEPPKPSKPSGRFKKGVRKDLAKAIEEANRLYEWGTVHSEIFLKKVCEIAGVACGAPGFSKTNVRLAYMDMVKSGQIKKSKKIKS